MRTNFTPITPPDRPNFRPKERLRTPTAPIETKTVGNDSNKSKPKPIEIHIALPKLPRLSFSKLKGALRKIPRLVYLLIVVIALLVAIGLFVLYVLNLQRKTDYTTITKNGTVITELSKVQQPEYNTLLPEGKTITELGGWTRVSPADRNPVFAYVDYIGKVQINVSEQPLPDSFKGDLENQVSYLAKGYHADVKVDAGGTDVYVGTSAKGPQSVIFTKNNLLVLIKTTAKVEPDDWATYVTSLK